MSDATLPSPKVQSLLVAQVDVPAVVGLSRSAFYRLKGAGDFPRPVNVNGAGPLYRRKDLERWVEKLNAGR